MDSVINFFDDQQGQGAAEYIMLFGGIIIIAISALVMYRAYFNSNSDLTAAKDMDQVRNFRMDTPGNSSSPPGGNGTSPPPSKP